MHPRNPYRVPPDFSALAEYFPALTRFVSLSGSGKPSINFQDQNAVITLTQALLKRDFNIALSLPENRLCPIIPNRLNYILWIQDILSPFDANSNQPVRGLDIGTGASAIYPLLACSLSPATREWRFVGTEIDSLSASFASKNVEVNGLSSRITIRQVTPPPAHPEESVGTILAPLIEEPESTFDFTMCNPPFYGSASEIENSWEGKELPPNAVCTGAETEMITPGGETGFVLQMVRESAQDAAKHRCRWFTSMLGKLNSVGTVVEELRKLEIHNYALTQFVQGTTRRWAVGWSFGDERLPDTLARPSSSSLSSYLPAPTTLRQSFPIPSLQQTHDQSGTVRSPHGLARSALSRVLETIDGLNFHASENTDGREGWQFDVQAAENTWSRAARRKLKRPSSSQLERVEKAPRLDSIAASTTPRNSPHTPSRRGDPAGVTRAALQCLIKALDASPGCIELGTSPSITLEVQWVRGIDRALFDGFWSHVCRKTKEKLS